MYLQALPSCMLLGATILLAACEAKKPAQAVGITTSGRGIVQPPARLAESTDTAVAVQQNMAVASASGAALDTAQLLVQAIGSKMHGYRLEEFSAGNLNGDKLPDFTVILRAVKPGPIVGAFQRRVVLVLNKGFPHLALAAYNDNIIECTNCGGGGVGDPHRGVIIRYPYLTFESLYGAWQKDAITITFRYSPRQKDWLLYKIHALTYSPEDKNNDGEVDSEEALQTKRDFGRKTFARF